MTENLTPSQISAIVRESIDNLKNLDVPNNTAWEFNELIADAFLYENTLVSLDSIDDAVWEPVWRADDEYTTKRLRSTAQTVADVKAIVIRNAIRNAETP